MSGVLDPAERPDLEGMRADLERRMRYAGVRKRSDANLQRILDYAARLEREAEGTREALESMVNQFAYSNVVKGQPAISTGGLSALEEAFDVLGLDDPHLLAAAPRPRR